jgi:hypothetical protein
MKLEASAVVQRIDDVLREAQHVERVTRTIRTHLSSGRTTQGTSYETSRPEDISRASMQIISAIEKYAPPGSAYLRRAEAVTKDLTLAHSIVHEQLVGMLLALRADYQSGRALESVMTLAHAGVFSDALAMAEHQLSQGYKDPAAVLACGVFEQHLRRIAERRGVALSKESGAPKNPDTVNQDLAKDGAYDLGTQKEVTAMLDLRNKAAHARWAEYDGPAVERLIRWVREFIERYTG